MSSSLLNASARQLAEPQDVSFQKSLYDGTFAGAHTLKLGRMLAQVAIRVNPKARAISVQGFGDQPILRELSASVNNGELAISAPLPFVAEDSAPRSRSRGNFNFQNGVFSGNVVGSVVSGHGMVISGGMVSVGSGISVINGVVYYDGREVDMSRKILLVISVPSETSIATKDTFGNVGIGGELQGELDLHISGSGSVYADSVRSFRTKLSGSGSVQLGTVRGRSKIKLSGSGVIDARELQGDIDASISGSGRIVVSDSRGSSGVVDISISGSGVFWHSGTVRGEVDFSISGMGNITIPRVTGRVRHSISGMGSAQVNGRTYTPRHGW